MKRIRRWGAALLLALAICLQAVLPGAALAATEPDGALPIAPSPEELTPAQEQRAAEVIAAPDPAAPETYAAPASEIAAAPEPAAREAQKVPGAGYVWIQSYETDTGDLIVGCSGAAANEDVWVEAWPNTDPDAVRTYDAVRVDDETREALVKLADFGYQDGWYTVRAYCGTEEDPLFLGTATAPVAFSRGTFSVALIGDKEIALDCTLRDAEIPSDQVVLMRVRRDADGTGRIYPLMRRGNVRNYCVYVSNHAAPGSYTAEAYIPSAEPTAAMVLGVANFQIEGVRSVETGITDIDGSNGNFSLYVDADAPSGVRSAQFAVWTQDDKSDLTWHDGESSDGKVFRAASSIREHDYNFGHYGVQAKLELGNGITWTTEEVHSSVDPHNYVYVSRVGAGKYKVGVLGADPQDAAAFRVAAWSDDNGQDDVVWYDVDADEQVGELCAAIDVYRHSDAGKYIAHVYAGDSFVGSVEFDVPASDLLSEAERRIARGVQRVYDAVGTDLHDNYMWVVNNFSYIRRDGHLKPAAGYTREQWYAVEGLEEQAGNCYTFAAAFCELAKGLGYDATYVEGAVFGVGQKWWPHGFVLINRNGSTYICDPELQFASSTGRNLYMQPISSPKATYRW